MAVYTVLRPSVGVGLKALDRTVFLSDRFCWPAFLFGPFWLLYRRVWLALLLTLVAIGLLAAAVFWFGWLRVNAEWIYVAIAAFLGFEGHRLREGSLARRGFVVADLIVAPGKPEAESLYFHRIDLTEPLPPRSAAPPFTPPLRGDPQIVGLFPQPDGRP
jgi:hypothetical protein